MKQLEPDLFERRFGDLMEIGRARLPALAPDWTDHNAHDPGITLMELLAWVAEAQMYSLSRRPRRDERMAYAALVGVVPGGTTAARGLIWPDHRDPQSPVATFGRSIVIPTDALVNVTTDEKPTFRPTHKILWVPGSIQRLETRLAGGRIIDQTAANERGGPAFLPFGDSAGRRDVLAMTFRCNGDATLLEGALWAIGVRTDFSAHDASADDTTRGCRNTLSATLVGGGNRVPLRIAFDSTNGLLSTGVLLFNVDNVTGSPREFTIELRAPQGFARPPRFLRIEPNVLPIVQGHAITSERHDATGLPDWNFTLSETGLRFAAGEEPVTIQVPDNDGLNAWKRCDRLSDRGPDERVFELDTAKGRVTFGNSVNGKVPPEAAQVLAGYAVSDGESGNVARNRQWRVTGIDGVFGVNVDPVAGGAASSSWIEQRREARLRSRDEHALVSSEDVVAAAKELPLLEVARAWVLPPTDKEPRTGVVTLVAMRANGNETKRWLDAVCRRLAGRMPLATRLVVAAPRYADFSVRATLVAAAGRNPDAVEKEVGRALKQRLAPLDWHPGVSVTRRDLSAWLRAVDGVREVVEVRLSGGNADEIRVSRGGLPRLDLDHSTIKVRRSTP